MASAYEELAAEVVFAQQMATDGGAEALPNSTIESGYLKIRGTGGLLVGGVGAFEDGSFGAYSLGGPTPPTPSFQLSDVTQVPGGVRVRVGGLWEAGGFAPLDFGRYEVYAGTSPTPSNSLLFDNLRGEVNSPRGGEATFGLPRGTDFYFWIVARSLSGKFSSSSAVVGPMQAGQMIESELDIDWNAWGGNQIFYGTSTPTTTKYGDLWLKQIGTSTGAAGGPPAGTPLYETRRWTPGTPDNWALVADQGITGALTAAVAAQQAADAKAKVFLQTTMPSWTGAANSAVWIDSDAGNAQYIFDGTTFVPRLLGNGAIQTNSLVASDVIATGTVSAALFEAIMILTNLIVIGPPTGTHLELDPVNGLRAFANDPIDGIPNEIGKFGGTVGVRNPTSGILVANIDENGNIQGQDLNINDPNPTFGGTGLQDMLWDMPWGQVGTAIVDTSANYWFTPRTNAEVGFLEFAFVPKPGRSYELTSEPFETATSTGDTAYIRLRRTTDGAAPTVTSTKFREIVVAPIRNGYSGSRAYQAFFDGPAPGSAEQTWRLLMTYGVGNGSTGVRIGAQDAFRFTVRDVGPQRPEIGQINSGGGTVASGETPLANGQVQPKTTVTKTYYGNWSRSWVETPPNTYRTDIGSAMDQGENGATPQFGIEGGAWAWHDIVSELAGATINKVELYLFCAATSLTTGMTANIGTHGVKDLPTAFPGQSVDWFSVDFARGQGKWITINQWASRIQSGAARGITIYANTRADQWAGRFYGVGPTNPPALRVTYSK